MNFLSSFLRPRKAGFTAIFMTVVLCLNSTAGAAQSVPEPRREQLLNGLPILLWERPGDANVLLKLRVHSGAAFDLAGKAGTMSLLADALFPDPTTRDYITQELGGKIEVTTDYDAINVTLAGRASDYERLVELLRAAIMNLSLTADRVKDLREARSKVAREMGALPTTIADRAVAARLFGDFPYGRPSGGATETLARVERGDVQYARERFLNSNNSTLIIIGGVERARAMRVLRQLLGPWRKSDTIVPSTFRQPEAPDTRTLVVDLPGAETAEVRLALRGLARSDRDYMAATVLALLARDRWQALLPEIPQSAFFVRHEARVLPGIFVMGASVKNADAARALAAARDAIQDLAKQPPLATEFERARSEALAVFNRQAEKPESVANLWLDIETYKLAPFQEQARTLSALSPSDIQRVAAKLLSKASAGAASRTTTDAPLVSVVVGNAAQFRAELERLGRIEVQGEAAAPPPPPKASETGAGSSTKKSP